LNKVVLPAPFGPIRPRIWPSSRSNDTPVERDDAAEPQSYVADIEKRRHVLVSGDPRQCPRINPSRAFGDKLHRRT